MHHRKVFGYLLVCFCAISLAIIVVEDIRALIRNISEETSAIEFLRAESGVFEDSLILMNGIDPDTSKEQNIPFLKYCSCFHMLFTIANYSEPCEAVELPIPYKIRAPNGSFVPATQYSTFLRNPRNFARGSKTVSFSSYKLLVFYLVS